MTFSQLRALLAVVDEGGFTSAAERLGMAQPAISRAIRSLEEGLGGPLLVRGREGIALTEAGRRAVSHAREAVRQHDLLTAEVASAIGQVTGSLTLASFPSATARLIPPRLRAFGDLYPQVDVHLFEGTDQEVRDWLTRGAADIGVVTLPCAHFDSIPLAEDELVVVLPRGHTLESEQSVTLMQVESERFILSTGGCELMITAAAREADVRLNVCYNAREVSTILAMVGVGLGVSIVPTLALPSGSAVSSRPLSPRLPRRLALAMPTLQQASPAARAFLAISEQISASGPS